MQIQGNLHQGQLLHYYFFQVHKEPLRGKDDTEHNYVDRMSNK